MKSVTSAIEHYSAWISDCLAKTQTKSLLFFQQKVSNYNFKQYLAFQIFCFELASQLWWSTFNQLLSTHSRVLCSEKKFYFFSKIVNKKSSKGHINPLVCDEKNFKLKETKRFTILSFSSKSTLPRIFHRKCSHNFIEKAAAGSHCSGATCCLRFVQFYM